jgi:general secretion pathway protein N
MMRKFLIVLAILGVFVGALVYTLPARFLYNHMHDPKSAVTLQNIQGPWWRGSADQLTMNGLVIGQFHWRVSWRSLLKLKPMTFVVVDGPQIKLKGFVQNSRLEYLKGRADAALLAPALAIPLVQPTGELLLDLPLLQMSDQGLPQDVQGDFRWRDAGLTGLASAAIGSVHVTANGSGGKIQGTVAHEGDGPLQIAGEFSLSDGQYLSEVRLKSANPKDPINQILPLIGVATADGGRLLKSFGVLQTKKATPSQ